MTQCNKETMVYVNWIYRYYGFKNFFYVFVFALKLHMLMLLSPPVSFFFDVLCLFCSRRPVLMSIVLFW